jgi:hypothetical protein
MSEPYEPLDMTPEQHEEIQEVSRKRLSLPPKYLLRLHVQGMLWKLRTHADEIEASTGIAPTAQEALDWVSEEIRKMEPEQ